MSGSAGIFGNARDGISGLAPEHPDIIADTIVINAKLRRFALLAGTFASLYADLDFDLSQCMFSGVPREGG
jgi:hypothetical protein